MYLNQRGLVIPKHLLSKEQIAKLKNDLTLIPKKSNPIIVVEEKPVITYRENEHKLYIPRFYGLQQQQLLPSSEIENKIPTGDSVNIPFVKELRDYQKNIVGVYFDHVKSGYGGAILEVPCGRGKCLGFNTPILMYDGTIKMVQDVEVGDVLMGDDSTPRNVLSLARGREKMYRVYSPTGHANYVANESHILSLRYKLGDNCPYDVSIADYLKLPKYLQGEDGIFVGYRVPVIFPNEKFVPVHAYTVGRWFGSICDSKPMKLLELLKKHHDNYDDCVKRKYPIPMIYKTNTRKTRLAFLAGVLDSPCTVWFSKHYYIFHECLQFVTDFMFLVRSLGFGVSYEGLHGKAYSCKLYGIDHNMIPVQEKHNLNRITKHEDNPLQYSFRIIPLGEDNYYGFEIDGNRRFMLGDFTVTHNTIMALNITSVLQKKTLILVHKEFLMNQWIERIADFIPTARIGKIQGQKFDIENKDIVIGMIQTMYKSNYSSTALNSFGLTIIDEVHRIGSEEFSKTLFKVSTPYMLGISATVERKDGLTEILYMFIGPKIYSEERRESSTVEVRAVMYSHVNEEYSTEEFDFRGKIKYSTMVSKISDFPPRQRFLVKILEDLVKENDDKQIMVLSHKRDLLDFLEKSINEKKFASCGQYVGGMKQKALQETEIKHIVLATYAMAAEALDIKTLNTLVMVSPKTDIIQSVGRILRTEGAGKIIVDVVDSHDVFKNQWSKRKTFYRKSNYYIKKVDMDKYKNMSNEEQYDILYDPSQRGKKKTAKTKKSSSKCKNISVSTDDDDCDDGNIEPSLYPF